ncbi:MAG: rod shape-determining protein RodA [Bacteroidia bacterium]|nr:rod shape-determining protein RodA [Bacteroidia bacterium]
MIRQPYADERIRIDWTTVMMYIIFIVFGAMNIYSADSATEGAFLFDLDKNYGKQILWIGICLVIIILILLTDPGFFNISGFVIYGIIIFLLVAVLTTGSMVSASKSWFKIGGFKLQPSEFAKYATALALSRYLGTFGVKFEGKNRLIAFGIILLPMILTLLQNDTGSALVFACFILVFYREGLSGWWILMGVYIAFLFVLTIYFGAKFIISFLAISTVVLITVFVFRKIKKLITITLIVFAASVIMALSVDVAFAKLQAHQQNRILLILGKKVDNNGIGYNLNQSKIAIGAGQLTGSGFNKGTQTKMKMVPEQHTDFIFCTVGEEYGFIGSSALVMLYLLFLGRLVYLAERQKTAFSRVFGYCTASVFFFHFFVNVGMTMGLIPVIGIPLPFFSYGGSSLFSFTMLLFTFLKLDANRVNEMSRAF